MARTAKAGTSLKPANKMTPLCVIPPRTIGSKFRTKQFGKRPPEIHTLTEVRYGELISTTPSNMPGVTFDHHWIYRDFQSATDGLEISPELYKILTTPPRVSELAIQ